MPRALLAERRRYLKIIKLENMVSIDGRLLKNTNDEPVTIKDYVAMFLFQIPSSTLKLEDSVNAQKYYLQATGQNGDRLRVEDREYEWVAQMIERFSAQVSGINAVKVQEAWANLEEEVDA